MNVNMLFDENDVLWPDLADQALVDRSQKLGVKIQPQSLLFEPWILSREMVMASRDT